MLVALRPLTGTRLTSAAPSSSSCNALRYLSTTIRRRQPVSSTPRRGKPSSTSSATAGTTAEAVGAAATQTLETISDSFHSIAQKFKSAVEHSHSEQYEGVEERGLRMLVFGKPGSGKDSSYVCSLVRDYDIAFVSTGDVLRKEIAAKSEVGQKAEAIVASGGLVSDELMLEIIKAELDRLHGKVWIIDGFPRTLHQGELLDKVLNEENRPLNMIVHLNVPDSVIMARIAARWVHLPSGRVYNTTYSAPKVAGKDDVTGEPLTKRPDDTPETFSKRLHAYYESTAPLLEYFAKTYPSSLFSLSGSSSDEVLIAAGLKSAPSPTQTQTQTENLNKSETTNQDSSTDLNRSPSKPAPSPTPTDVVDPNLKPFAELKFTPKTDSAQSLAALDQLWPQLVSLIEPFNLRRKPAEDLTDEEVKEVRKEADDLKDPGEVDMGDKKGGKRTVQRE
ncbi:adenylate kinase [Kwoniella heveanensis CBS 569]|nr:adenylate kinase [Kwoniella heveanensis CBS 569]